MENLQPQVKDLFQVSCTICLSLNRIPTCKRSGHHFWNFKSRTMKWSWGEISVSIEDSLVSPPSTPGKLPGWTGKKQHQPNSTGLPAWTTDKAKGRCCCVPLTAGESLLKIHLNLCFDSFCFNSHWSLSVASFFQVILEPTAYLWRVMSRERRKNICDI